MGHQAVEAGDDGVIMREEGAVRMAHRSSVEAKVRAVAATATLFLPVGGAAALAVNRNALATVLLCSLICAVAIRGGQVLARRNVAAESWRASAAEIMAHPGLPAVGLAHAAFMAWAWTSLSWSIADGEGWERAIGHLAMATFAPLVCFALWWQGAAIAGPRWLGAFATALRWAICVSACWLVLSGLPPVGESLANAGVQRFELNRLAALLTVSCCALWMMPSGRLTAACWVLGTAGVLVSESQAAQLGWFVAIGAGAVVRWRGAVRLVFAPVALFVIAVPLLVPLLPVTTADVPVATGGMTGELAARANASHRLAIWRGFGERIAERPLIGHGAGGSAELGLDAVTNRYNGAEGFPGTTPHPHSAALQVWLDYGGVGAVLAALIVVASARTVAAMDTSSRSAWSAAFAALAVLAFTSHEFMSTAPLALMVFAAALTALASSARKPACRGRVR